MDPIVAELIDNKIPKYPNIKVEAIKIGEIIPRKHIHKIDITKKAKAKINLFSPI